MLGIGSPVQRGMEPYRNGVSAHFEQCSYIDPVAGIVEVPCVKRNALGSSFALVAADMALAGIESQIPVDEVVDAMYHGLLSE